MQKIFRYLLSIVLFSTCSYTFAAEYNGLIYPAVTFTNESNQKVFVVWYADLAKMNQVKKYADVIEAHEKNLALKNGITYYARANANGSGLTQNDIVHITVYGDFTQQKLLGAATYNLASYSKQDIQKDEKILLKVTIDPKFVVHISDQNKNL